ncbi:MAG: FAD-dependent oxidoreductase, partial [Firmicutes bacterium]|nr:FAD-dependent oxidoreductase [Bacillota bacterium]
MTQQIAIVGGGYAGLGAISALRHVPNIHIVLIDSSLGHQLIPEMPEALAKRDTVEQHILPFHDLLLGHHIEHIAEEAIGLDALHHTITLKNDLSVPFDWAVLAPGSVPFFPPIPGLVEHARPLRNAYDTVRIKSSLKYAKNQRIAIVGGGLTGVEVAGTLALDHDVVLIEGYPHLLPALGKGLSDYTYRRLLRAGVTVVLGQKLQAVDNRYLHLERDTYGYDVLIWAGGIAPPMWLRETGLPLNDKGYPIVDNTGEIVPQIYAAGDIWQVFVDNQMIPATAQL